MALRDLAPRPREGNKDITGTFNNTTIGTHYGLDSSGLECPIHRPSRTDAESAKQPHSADRSPQTPAPNVRLNRHPYADAVAQPRGPPRALVPPPDSRIDQVMLLELTGRGFGRRIRVPVALHLIDGVPMAFTHRPWRLNFTGAAPVTITHRGQVRQGHGVLLPATPGADR
jgi:hypothetical protein